VKLSSNKRHIASIFAWQTVHDLTILLMFGSATYPWRSQESHETGDCDAVVVASATDVHLKLCKIFSCTFGQSVIGCRAFADGPAEDDLLS